MRLWQLFLYEHQQQQLQQRLLPLHGFTYKTLRVLHAPCRIPPNCKTLSFVDVLRGPVTFSQAELDDFICFRPVKQTSAQPLRTLPGGIAERLLRQAPEEPFWSAFEQASAGVFTGPSEHASEKNLAGPNESILGKGLVKKAGIFTEAECGRAEALWGVPVYNFCAAVDDWLMGVTAVVRGEEHINNSLKWVLLLLCCCRWSFACCSGVHCCLCAWWAFFVAIEPKSKV